MTFLQLSILIMNLWVIAYNRNNNRLLSFGSYAWMIIIFIEWVRQG